MLPGRSTNITRELKLNRLVDEKQSNIDLFNKTIKIQIPPDYSKIMDNFDFDKKFEELIQNEYIQNYCKNILQHLTINITPKKLSLSEIGITDLLSFPNKDFDTFIENMEGFAIVTNSQVGTYLQDFASFNVKFIHTTVLTNSLPYIIGDIHNKEIYVDPYMKWTDNRIFAIKKPFYDVSNYTISEHIKDEATFRPFKEIFYTLYFDKPIEDYVDIYELTS